MRIATLFLLTCVGVLPSCTSGETEVPASDTATVSGTDLLRPSSSEGSPSEGSSDALRVVFLGTSLTEGLGLAAPEVEAWPARVHALAESHGLALRVVNAGLGGDTSAGTLRRVDWVLQQDPDVLVVETGANDGLRALPTEALEANLTAIIVRVREARPETEVVLAAMEAPPNLGPEYSSSFREVFLRAAAAGEVPLTRFLLDGVAGIPELNQSDGIHPTASGHQRMAENAWPVLDSIFRVASERRAGARP